MRRQWDYLAGPARHIVKALEWEAVIGLLNPGHGESLLEIGCGLGERVDRFRDRGLAVTGLEPDFKLTADAGPTRAIQIGAPDRLPFEDRAFDLVLMAPLLHQLKDPKAAVAEAVRCARRLAVIELLNPVSLSGLYPRPRPDSAVTPWQVKRWLNDLPGSKPVSGLSIVSLPRRWLGWTKALEKSALPRRLMFGGLVFLVKDLTGTPATLPRPARAKLSPTQGRLVSSKSRTQLKSGAPNEGSVSL